MTGVPLNIDWQQILLHLFNFTILFGALYILLYKPVKNFMESRVAHYKDVDDKAEAALKDAENQQQIYAAKVAALDEELTAEKSKARKEIDAMREKELEAAKNDASKILSEARAEAAREKAGIVSAAQKEIRDLVTEAVDKLNADQSPSDAFDSFLDAAEAEGSEH